MRIFRLRRWSSYAALAMVVTLTGQWAATAAGPDEGPYPGLPKHTGSGGWVGATQSGIGEAARARQWFNIPSQTAAVFNKTTTASYPDDDPLNRAIVVTYTNYIYFVAPVGSERNYGLSPEFKVRTVAFGTIPVEATIQMIQRQREDGSIIPIVASSTKSVYNTDSPDSPKLNVNDDTLIEDGVTLRITRLVVDGVDLAISRDGCQTAERGALKLVGKGWTEVLDPTDITRAWETGKYSPASGGQISGTIAVPAFKGCVTETGEDVSRLLTSTVSGPGNKVTLNVSSAGCSRPVPPAVTGSGPPRPGETTYESAGCAASGVIKPPEIPIPARP